MFRKLDAVAVFMDPLLPARQDADLHWSSILTGSCPDPIRYIGLDQKLCEIEPPARRLEIILDKWEQDCLDEIRGK